MNRIFKVIWSKSKQCKIVVSEIVNSFAFSAFFKSLKSSSRSILSVLILYNLIFANFIGFTSYAFSLSGLIYDKEDLSLPLQVMFQMGIGFIVLFSVAIYLGWLPLTFGIGVIIEWIIIAIIFASVSWLGFYIYYYLEAREINQKLQGFISELNDLLVERSELIQGSVVYLEDNEKTSLEIMSAMAYWKDKDYREVFDIVHNNSFSQYDRAYQSLINTNMIIKEGENRKFLHETVRKAIYDYDGYTVQNSGIGMRK